MRWNAWVFFKSAKNASSVAKLRVEELERREVPSVAGVVFRDYDQDGIRDSGEPGVAGVRVTAYNSSGTMVEQVDTSSTGTYGLTTSLANIRLEFTNLPSNLLPGKVGTQAGSTVRFLDASTAVTGVNLGVNNPIDYVEGTPNLVTNRYIVGDPTSVANSNFGTIVAFANSSSGTTPTPATIARAGQVGATWGLAQAPGSKVLYASAYAKRHAGFGTGGPGGIYKIDTSNSTPTVTLLVDINSLDSSLSAGTNPHPNATTDFTTDTATAALVGKVGFGDIDLSEDGRTLYAVNLNTRELLEIPLDASGNYVGGTIRHTPVPLSLTNDARNFNNPQDIRPFALAVQDGVVYLGEVYSAETSGNQADLRAYVYAFNPGTGTFSGSPVFEVDLTYAHGSATTGGSGDWQPWINDPSALTSRAMPMLTDLAFDNGDLILAFRDRGGDQVNATSTFRPAGDILRASANPTVGWTLESNGTVGGRTSSLGVGNGDGPGGGEFYSGDFFATVHDETALGGIVQIPGAAVLAATGYDTNLSEFSAGAMWMNNVTGSKARGFDVYTNNQTTNFGTANGLGSLQIQTTAAPIELGNRIWKDEDGDGIQDAGELGISGVTVRLFRGTTLAGTAITNSNGEYLFNETNVAGGVLANTAYEIRVDVLQAALGDFSMSRRDQGGNDAIDSDALFVNGNAVITVTTGGAGSNNHTLDFGFRNPAYSIGNRVWNDLDNNGTQNGSETGIEGVVVELLDSTGNLLGSTTTDFNGDYLFTNLVEADYRLRLAASNFLAPGVLVGFTSSLGTNNSNEPAPDPDNFLDNTDDGSVSGTLGTTGVIQTGIFSLTNDQNASDGDADPDTNFTFDFGLFRRFSIGNQVWNDANNNGQRDSAEVGLAGVVVNLYAAGGTTPLATTTTDSNGRYLFTNLMEGDYFVELAASNFATGATYANFTSSTGGAASEPRDPDLVPTDNDDNGTITGTLGSGGSIRSEVLTLAADTEPLLENPNNDPGTADGNSNLTVDFGLFRVTKITGTVFVDLDRDGVIDVGEQGLATPVTLTLKTSGGSTVATTTTANDGTYEFNNIPLGSYIVEQTQPNGYGSSSPNAVPITLTATPGVVNFGETTTTLSGRVFMDFNNNGLFNGPDRGIAGVTVTLTGTPTGGSAITPIVKVTDSNGFYSFTDLLAGTYTVTETAPTDSHYDGIDTLGNAGGVSSNDTFSNITIATNAQASGYNFAEIPRFDAFGYVYNDLNGNGTLDGSGNTQEAGISGSQISLVGLDVRGTAINQTATTGSDGRYVFTGIAPGVYTIQQVVQPANFLDGKEQNGIPAGTVANDVFAAIDFKNGPPTSGYNFGEVEPGSISGSVYVDANNNGTRDGTGNTAEAGIQGVTIKLTGRNDLGVAVNLTATTDPLGNFAFSNLRPGTYTITETQPASHADGTEAVGTGGGLTNVNDSFRNIVLNSGANISNYQFGERVGTNLVLTANASKTKPTVGELVTFNFTVRNGGSVDATGVLVNGLLNSGFTYVETTGTPIGTFDSATGVWTVGNLAIGAEATLSIVLRVKSTGNYRITAQASSTEPELSPANNRVVLQLDPTGLTGPGAGAGASGRYFSSFFFRRR